ncbi:AMP-binding protein [Prosthecomicrobium pneumaticum]|uniref:AMP-dependent synthetase/ligase domain-containing protein n=1 Tax=Prosthecomicrobium pneumaticum TaxID=81895 RepID=A0A7W9CSR3_9HYPH|nr:hypothetical protein [Prosthecomicrobium pneumaticum]
MIAADPARLARHAAAGLSGTATLDRLLAKQAAAHPDALALADDPERAAWNDLPPERLSWRALDARVDALAGFFQMIGLLPDAVVALHAPPTVDTVVTLLAVFRAGLIAAPLPLLSSAEETAAQLARIRPSALVSHRRVEALGLADTARAAAADVPGLRFVFGFGPGLSDGVLDLGTMLRFGGGAVPGRVARADNPADHAATLTFGAEDGAEQPALHRRSANQWIATAAGPMLEARIGPGTTLLSPYALSGVAGIGAALVPWLLSGGTLHLHHCRDMAGLAAHIGAVAPDIVLAPALVVPALAARVATPPRAWLALHRDGGGAARPLGDTAGRLIDVSAPAEATLVARRRIEARPAALPVGPIAAAGEGGPVLAETRIARTASGARLYLRGAAVAEPVGPGGAEVLADGFVPAGPVAVDAGGETFRLTGGVPEPAAVARTAAERRGDRMAELARPAARAATTPRPVPAKAGAEPAR